MAKKRGNNEGTIVKRKDGRWMASITIGRDPTTGKLKRASFYGKTRQEAAEHLAKALRDKGQGIFVAPHRLTLGEWLHTWLHDVYGALEQAIKHQLMVRNVSRLTIRPRKTDREMHALTLDQVAMSLFPAITQHRLFPSVLLAFSTGLRRGELLAVRWEDLDLTAAVLHVRQHLVCVRLHDAPGEGKKTALAFHEPKTSQSQRTIPLTPEAVIALRRHKARQAEERLLLGQAYQDHGLVFCKEDGRPINPKVFLRQFQRLLLQAGLPKVRVHDARHTFATLMLELGESPKTVQTLLGHSRIATTLDIYSHVSLEPETRAVARLDAALKARAKAGGE